MEVSRYAINRQTGRRAAGHPDDDHVVRRQRSACRAGENICGAGLVAVRGHRHRNRGLRLRLSAGHDGVHPPRIHQCARRRGHQSPDGPVRPPAHLPERRIPRRDRAEHRHPVHPGLVRRVEGAVDRHRPGHGRPLLPAADDGRLDQRLRLAGHPQRRRQGARPSRSPAPTGTAACRRTCWSTSRRRRWCGCWAASTARAPRRITTRCTSCRIRSPRRRCRRSASNSCRRCLRSPRRSTW